MPPRQQTDTESDDENVVTPGGAPRAVSRAKRTSSTQQRISTTGTLVAPSAATSTGANTRLDATRTTGRQPESSRTRTDAAAAGSSSRAAAGASSSRSTTAKTTTRRAPSASQTRRRPGEKALSEIRRFQKTTHMLIPRLSFARVVKEISELVAINSRMRWQAQALEALQVAAEDYLVHLFEDS